MGLLLVGSSNNLLSYETFSHSFFGVHAACSFQLFGSVNNLNGARDLSVLQMYPGIQQSGQDYDLTAVVGLDWQF